MSRWPYHLWLYLGVLLLLVGLQLRGVETFVFRPSATRMVHHWLGPPRDTPAGAFQRLSLDSDDMARRHYRPPEWLGYAFLAAGAVATFHGLVRRNSR